MKKDKKGHKADTRKSVKEFAKRSSIDFSNLRKQTQQRVGKIYRQMYNLDNETRHQAKSVR